MQNKTRLRQALLAARHATPDEVRVLADRALVKHLMNWLTMHAVSVLGVYWPIQNEPDVRAAYSDLVARGMQLALPVVTDKSAPLMYKLWVPGEPLEKDLMGVPAPLTHRTVVVPDAILVPCVGFNAALYRLGYGGGYYDRTLATAPRPITLGIAFASACCAFKAAPHDVALDVVITESAVQSN